MKNVSSENRGWCLEHVRKTEIEYISKLCQPLVTNLIEYGESASW